jgi:hypothetical protein
MFNDHFSQETITAPGIGEAIVFLASDCPVQIHRMALAMNGVSLVGQEQL